MCRWAQSCGITRLTRVYLTLKWSRHERSSQKPVWTRHSGWEVTPGRTSMKPGNRRDPPRWSNGAQRKQEAFLCASWVSGNTLAEQRWSASRGGKIFTVYKKEKFPMKSKPLPLRCDPEQIELSQDCGQVVRRSLPPVSWRASWGGANVVIFLWSSRTSRLLNGASAETPQGLTPAIHSILAQSQGQSAQLAHYIWDTWLSTTLGKSTPDSKEEGRPIRPSVPETSAM